MKTGLLFTLMIIMALTIATCQARHCGGTDYGHQTSGRM